MSFREKTPKNGKLNIFFIVVNRRYLSFLPETKVVYLKLPFHGIVFKRVWFCIEFVTSAFGFFWSSFLRTEMSITWRLHYTAKFPTLKYLHQITDFLRWFLI